MFSQKHFLNEIKDIFQTEREFAISGPSLTEILQDES